MQHWHERWAREALRVLKPGAYLLAFGSTRAATGSSARLRARALRSATWGLQPCSARLAGASATGVNATEVSGREHT